MKVLQEVNSEVRAASWIVCSIIYKDYCNCVREMFTELDVCMQSEHILTNLGGGSFAVEKKI